MGGVLNDQSGVQAPTVAADNPPPAEAMAPIIMCVRAEFWYSACTLGKYKSPRVEVTALVRKRASSGQRMVSTIGG
jgi:hypothetical protein